MAGEGGKTKHQIFWCWSFSQNPGVSKAYLLRPEGWREAERIGFQDPTRHLTPKSSFNQRSFVTFSYWASQVVPEVKNLATNAGDTRYVDSIPGVGNSNSLQYSCLENSMNREAWCATVDGVAKSRTWLSMHAMLWHFGLLIYIPLDKIYKYHPPTPILNCGEAALKWKSWAASDKSPTISASHTNMGGLDQ